MSLFDTLNRIEVSDPDDAAEVPTSEHAEAFHAVVEGRRSVRRFTADPVPDDVFERAMRAAVLAPNSSNLQPWEFIRVRSPEVRAKVAEAAMGQPAATTAAEIVVCVARWDRWRANRDAMLEAFRGHDVPDAVLDYYGKVVPLTWSSGPLGLVGWGRWLMSRVLTWARPVPQFDGGGLYPRIVAIKSCALACQTLMLALHAEGFDSCPMEGFDGRRVAKAVGLRGGGHEIVMLLGIGRRAPGGIYGGRWRLPLERVLRTL